MEMASAWNMHCANCIGTLSFPLFRNSCIGVSYTCRQGCRGYEDLGIPIGMGMGWVRGQ